MFGRKQLRQVLVVGLGRFGGSIARTLCEEGVQVFAVDTSPELVEDYKDVLTQVVQADSTDREAMEAIGVSDFDTAFITVGSDLKASCVTTMLMKELGVKQVIAKAKDEFHGRMLEKLGADKVLYPERDMGRRVAHNYVSSNLLEYIELSPNFSMTEIVAEQSWVGKTLKELNLRARLGINVVAVRSGEAVNAMPSSDTRLEEGNILLVVTTAETLNRLNKL